MQVLSGLKVNVCVYHRQVRAASDLSWLDVWQNRRDSMYLCGHIAGPELSTPKTFQTGTV